MFNEYWRKKNLQYLNYNSLVAFQRDFGCTMIDGIYGPETDSKLQGVIWNIQYKLGFIGDELDSKAGNETIRRTKEFQKAHGLNPDGIAGPLTRNALNDVEYSWDKVKHFRKDEFTCKCGCGYNNIDLRLVYILDEIREHYSKPLIVTSGTRCEKHNREVGGVQGSRHCLGKASDIYVEGVTSQQLLAYCQGYVNKHLARYTYTNNKNMNGVVHIDIN